MTFESLRGRLRPVLVALPALGLAAGFLAWFLGAPAWPPAIWTTATLPVLLALLAEIAVSLRRGDLGLDIVAALSMSAALVFGEHLAACVVALMYSGGQYLEHYAERRARREMTALLSRVPREALRHRNGGLEPVPLDDVRPGDRLLVRHGDIVPVDGVVAGGAAVLDQSALTGEALPVRRAEGEAALSGATNVGNAFDLLASRPAAQSTYAGIVRLVEEAQRSRAPMTRIADRFALVFLAATVLLAGGAWFLTGDPVRAVAVLVVATPCPLILAVPVALVSGLSRAAANGILIKGGKGLEAMARIRAVVLDKTGTLTEGSARLVAVETYDGRDETEVLRLAASLDQASKHIVAQAIVAEARGRGLALAIPDRVVETAGDGIAGEVEGHVVLVGGTAFVAGGIGVPDGRFRLDGRPAGSLTVAVAIDGRPAGQLILRDALRAGAAAFLKGVGRFGIGRIVLATGDRRDVAEAVSAGLPFDEVHAGLTPDRKIAVVAAERRRGPVMMVGDGVNDAPALAAADVGVAMGAHGSAASAEAADVVLLVDRLDRLLPGLAIARRARRIALQSVYAGIGLSGLGMVAAAFGAITSVEGALLQEAIDIAVILNALRVLRPDPAEGASHP